jgi:hypothetical protein
MNAMNGVGTMNAMNGVGTMNTAPINTHQPNLNPIHFKCSNAGRGEH